MYRKFSVVYKWSFNADKNQVYEVSTLLAALVLLIYVNNGGIYVVAYTSQHSAQGKSYVCYMR